MIDVGANSGESFVNYSSAGWKIYAFEPDPSITKQKQLKDFSKIGSVEIYNYAVGEVDGQILDFFASDESNGVSSLSPFLDSHKKVCLVETITLIVYKEK